MRSFLPAIPRTFVGATADRLPAWMFLPRTNIFPFGFWSRISRVVLFGALAFLLFVPALFGGESSPSVKTAVAPKYPALTLAGRVDGIVTVRVSIDRTGAVTATDVVKGHPMLREAALDAAQQWKFEEGAAAKRSVTLKFSFVILPDSSVIKSQTVFLPPTGIESRQKPVEPTVEDEYGEFTLNQHPISTT